MLQRDNRIYYDTYKTINTTNKPSRRTESMTLTHRMSELFEKVGKLDPFLHSVRTVNRDLEFKLNWHVAITQWSILNALSTITVEYNLCIRLSFWDTVTWRQHGRGKMRHWPLLWLRSQNLCVSARQTSNISFLFVIIKADWQTAWHSGGRTAAEITCWTVCLDRMNLMLFHCVIFK